MNKPLAAACLVSLLTAAGHASADAPCTMQRPDAAGKIVITAHVPQVLPVCYAFTPAAGQKAQIDITEGDTMGFGLEEIAADGSTRALGDNHHSTSFTADAQIYHVLAGPASTKVDSSHEFTLTIVLK